MSQQFKILLFLSLLLLSYQQQQVQQEKCINGQNCPSERGTCIADYCKCNEGYYTFKDKTLPPGYPQTYCNYEQTSQYQALILEFLLLGHFSAGHYWLGTFKVFLIVTFLSLTYYIYGEFEFPRLFLYLAEIIGFTRFLPRGGLTMSEKILDMIREVAGIIWSVMYFADLFLYSMNIYKDGNGVPLA